MHLFPLWWNRFRNWDSRRAFSFLLQSATLDFRRYDWGFCLFFGQFDIKTLRQWFIRLNLKCTLISKEPWDVYAIFHILTLFILASPWWWENSRLSLRIWSHIRRWSRDVTVKLKAWTLYTHFRFRFFLGIPLRPFGTWHGIVFHSL